MKEKRIGMVLTDAQGKKYKGYCFYDSKDRLQGWVLGDEEDAKVVAGWLSEKVAESDAEMAAYMAKTKEDEAKEKHPTIMIANGSLPVVLEVEKPKRKWKPKVETADLPLPEESKPEE